MKLPKKLIRLTGPKASRKTLNQLEDALKGDPAVRAELEKIGVAAIREAFAREAANIGRDWHMGAINAYRKSGRTPKGRGVIAGMERLAIVMHRPVMVVQKQPEDSTPITT